MTLRTARRSIFGATAFAVIFMVMFLYYKG